MSIRTIALLACVLTLASPSRAQTAGDPRRADRPPIVLLGDSITARGPWAEAFPSARLINLAVEGGTTTDMLARAGQAMAARPAKIFMMGGINDLKRGRSVEQVLDTYAQLLARLDDGGRWLVVQSTLQVRPPAEQRLDDALRRLNEGLFLLCIANRRCTFVDLNETLAASGPTALGFSADGLHPDAAGYQAWFRLLKTRRLLD